jgi:hypothetical protein
MPLLHTDDDLGAVNQDFLGPSGYTLPFRARYSAYGVGLTLTALAWWLVHRFGLPVNAFTFVWFGLGIVLATRQVGRWVSHETPLRSLLVVFGHEVCAPRPGRKPTVAVLRPGRVRVLDGGRHVCRGCEAHR